mmetsp:Transcript_9347/g.14793  ORF Transcript_9347/g.14793 Transcript_9347/m.14793 type:complete len:95 (-) Transcript_9347:972-1256(-)
MELAALMKCVHATLDGAQVGMLEEIARNASAHMNYRGSTTQREMEVGTGTPNALTKERAIVMMESASVFLDTRARLAAVNPVLTIALAMELVNT